MKKRAFTLLELVVTLCIASILFSLGIRVLIREIRSFDRELNYTVSYSSMNEALNFIENAVQLQGNVNVANNKIEIIDENKNKIKTIELIGSNLKINDKDLKGYNNKKTPNPICRRIKSFEINKNGRVMLVKIKDSMGRECARFIPLEN